MPRPRRALGLGLSIVRHLVEMHGGDVRADSGGLGTGATFTVRLPVRMTEQTHQVPGRAAEAKPAPRLLTEPRLSGSLVLVVDDDQDTRELLVSVLEAAGATVHSAASAAKRSPRGSTSGPMRSSATSRCRVRMGTR
jgi:hypothetical protein